MLKQSLVEVVITNEHLAANSLQMKMESAHDCEHKESLEKRCEVCLKQISKYKCPRCGIRTCCLECVKEHKSKTSCNGIRDKAKFIKVSEFTDGDLLSDYRFLEELDRSADNSNRLLKKQRNCTTKSMRILTQGAKQNNVKLILAPSYSSMRKENTTYYCFKSKGFQWRIELNFVSSSNYKITDTRVPDISTLNEVIQKHFENSSNHLKSLRDYQDENKTIKDVNIYMKVERLQANCIRYYKLDGNKTLRENFQSKTIVEFPKLIVSLRDFSQEYEQQLLVENTEEKKTAPSEITEKRILPPPQFESKKFKLEDNETPSLTTLFAK